MTDIGKSSNGTQKSTSSSFDSTSATASSTIESERIEVLKTYKLYIGGAFPRTESGRYLKLKDQTGCVQANICRASRKDLRESVKAARAAFPGWSKRSAYNRGQILYRIAEILEGRTGQFVEEIVARGFDKQTALKEVHQSIDRLTYYAGWTDKYQQIFSTVNPVASAHFSFSILEPVGVVGLMAPIDSPLLGLVSLIAPIIAGGNTVTVLSTEKHPAVSITLAEVLATSDVPAGVVNILTGLREELLPHFASHMDINTFAISDGSPEEVATVQKTSCGNLKRVRQYSTTDWSAEQAQSPYLLLDFQETKTTWHPIGK